MCNVGFSSGALAYGDFRRALAILSSHSLKCLELSALRVAEVESLLNALPDLDLSAYSYISFHAPSSYAASEEQWLSNLLFSLVPETWPIVMHPDAIYDFGCWRRFGKRLAIENMDRRKPVGRTANELASIFAELPEATLCFDLGHARQCDSSMTEAFRILSHLGHRLVQVHISEVNSASQHDPISYGAKLAFRQMAKLIPEAVPVIVESKVSANLIEREVEQAIQSLSRPSACLA